MTSSLLRNIHNGSEHSKLVVIKGKLPTASPLPIWLSLLASWKRLHPCHVITAIGSVIPNFYLHDCTSLQVQSAQQQLEHIDLLFKSTSTETPSYVFIDDLDLMFFHYSSSCVISHIKRLCDSSRILGVVVLLNCGAHDDEVSACLEYYATTVISVEKACSIASSVALSLTLLHRKKSGKVSRDILTVGLDQDLKLASCCSTTNETVNSDSKTSSETKTDPTVGLTTFNLTLTDGERDAKSQVKLPYTKSEDAKASELSGGRIVYEPDEYDDLDEEDPDDDLDI